ncbi:Plasmodium exported protein, unknown function [Plasmodium gonderi]|uniref:Pv-fam-d protein n=1 Tax=Plasmodium gonderi TaxID=77519 RepID=A0A1Y1JGC0_PLAGO|nr:Plasmodium exported protein, unknown function [Plasmodium gonderi]GAW81556.1 Plasmodium exported protein, unknown function [Plasmodium gonderi]
MEYRDEEEENGHIGDAVKTMLDNEGFLKNFNKLMTNDKFTKQLDVLMDDENFQKQIDVFMGDEKFQKQFSSLAQGTNVKKNSENFPRNRNPDYTDDDTNNYRKRSDYRDEEMHDRRYRDERDDRMYQKHQNNKKYYNEDYEDNENYDDYEDNHYEIRSNNRPPYDRNPDKSSNRPPYDRNPDKSSNRPPYDRKPDKSSNRYPDHNDYQGPSNKYPNGMYFEKSQDQMNFGGDAKKFNNSLQNNDNRGRGNGPKYYDDENDERQFHSPKRGDDPYGKNFDQQKFDNQGRHFDKQKFDNYNKQGGPNRISNQGKKEPMDEKKNVVSSGASKKPKGKVAKMAHAFKNFVKKSDAMYETELLHVLMKIRESQEAGGKPLGLKVKVSNKITTFSPVLAISVFFLLFAIFQNTGGLIVSSITLVLAGIYVYYKYNKCKRMCKVYGKSNDLHKFLEYENPELVPYKPTTPPQRK